VPAYFESTSFIQGLSNRLATSGVLVFNKVVQNTDHKSQFNNLLLELSSVFRSVLVNEQLGLNRFIIAKK